MKSAPAGSAWLASPKMSRASARAMSGRLPPTGMVSGESTAIRPWRLAASLVGAEAT